MRKISFLFLMVIVIACSKKTAAPAKSDTPVPPVEAPAAPPAEVTSGKTLYDGKCGRCHAFKQPELYPAQNWVGIMDKMAPKARLTDDEKKQVLAYVQYYAKK